MKNIFELQIVAVILMSSLVACNYSPPKSPDLRVPDMVMPTDLQRILDLVTVCNKKDSDLPLSQIDANSTLSLADKIESTDIQSTDCDGKVTSAHGPIRDFDGVVSIEPDSALSGPVNYIKVNNLRTCASQQIDVTKEQALELEETELPNGAKAVVPVPVFSSADLNGNSRIRLSDSSYKLGAIYLNVKEGNNVIVVRYFGKCLKYKEKKDATMGDSYNCETAEELGQKQVLLKLKIDRPEVAGILKKDTCYKKQ